MGAEAVGNSGAGELPGSGANVMAATMVETEPASSAVCGMWYGTWWTRAEWGAGDVGCGGGGSQVAS